jgi:hypothetical protein
MRTDQYCDVELADEELYNINDTLLRESNVDGIQLFYSKNNIKPINLSKSKWHVAKYYFNDNIISYKQHLISEVRALSTKYKWKECDMVKPPALIINNVISFINQCNNDNVFKSVSAFLRPNGTVLIQFYVNSITACVNIGRNAFSYAIVNDNSDNDKCNEAGIKNADAIHQFYDLLK